MCGPCFPHGAMAAPSPRAATLGGTPMPQLDTGDTAWMLVATALVLFMTPGLAFFYGGMVRSKNVLGMLMQNFFAMGLLAVLWAVVGFSLAFGKFGDGGWIGDFSYAGMSGVGPNPIVLGQPSGI